MTRLFCVGIVLAGVMLAIPALAAIPNPDNCVVFWAGGFEVPDTISYICPAGGRSYLDVTVKDQFDLPISGQLVTATFGNTNVLLKSLCQGYTDSNGKVTLYVFGGLIASSSVAIRSTVLVSCMGQTLYTNDRMFTSPNMNGIQPDPPGIQIVDPLDFSILGADWLMTGCSFRSDFNGDCQVEGLDFSIFGADWLHT